METCFNYANMDKAYFSSTERRFINRVRKMAAEHPDEVRILKQPEDNDGCIYAEMPVRCMRIQFPVRRELSEEEKNAQRERMRKCHEQGLANLKK